MSSRLTRRGMLMAGATAAGAAVVIPASPAFAGDNRARSHTRLAGSWDITHQDEPSQAEPSPTPVRSIVSLTSDGILITIDVNPPSPTGLGTWQATGRTSLSFVFVSGNGDGPPPSGIAVLTVVGTAQVNGDTISGSYQFTATDGTGNTLQTGTGKFHGQRLAVPS